MALYLGKKRVAPSVQVKVPSMKAFFDAGGKCAYSNATSFEGIIKYEDTSNVTDMTSMFNSCSSLTSIPLFDTSKVTNMDAMFINCSNLSSIPQFNTSRVKMTNDMFKGCYRLTNIPSIDVSAVVRMNLMFYSCNSLTEIHMYGMKVDFDISSSTKFTREALVEILNNLATVTSTQTLTMRSTNLAKLTDEDKAIATGKGWTLA